MPRCKNCKQRFEPRYFLQKICDRDECKDAHNEYQANARKQSNPGNTGKPTRKPIKKVSSKQAKINTAYTVLRKQFLKDHPLCMVRISPNCTNRSTEIHHDDGRGKNTLDSTTWHGTCRNCHNHIHFVDPKKARELGFLK